MPLNHIFFTDPVRCHAHDDGVYGVDMNSEIVASAGDDGLVKIFKRWKIAPHISSVNYIVTTNSKYDTLRCSIDIREVTVEEFNRLSAKFL